MFVFVSHLTVPDSDREVLDRYFFQRSHLVDDFPGFLYLPAFAAGAQQSAPEAYEVLMDSRYGPEVR